MHEQQKEAPLKRVLIFQTFKGRYGNGKQVDGDFSKIVPLPALSSGEQGRAAGLVNHLMVSGNVVTVPRLDCAVMLVAPPGMTGEFNLEKAQPPNRLTDAVPITAPVVSGPT